jgi:D-alanyl-D-alanine carboxypeptidase
MNWLRLTKGFFLACLFLLFFVYMVSGTQMFFQEFPQIQNGAILQANISGAVQDAESKIATDKIIQPAPKPEINAEAAISVESNLADINKTIFEKDSNVRLPIASLTKLMTAVVVLDNYNFSQNITVDKISDSQAATKQDVKLGDNMPIESFFDIMLIESSNKSAYALSQVMGEQKFVDLMNEKAAEIGLNSTFFADPTGLSPNNVSTANDLSNFAKYILKNYPKIVDISRTKELVVPNFGKIENTDQLLGEIPEVVCSKTGFTTQAKGCLLLAVYNAKNNDYLISVILGADDRFSEMRKLINWASAMCN